MRKTRRKFTWFPVIGGDTEDGDGIELSTATRTVPVTESGSVQTDVIPLIPDEPSEVPAQGDHLVDYIGTSWFIKRLVGKLHLAYGQHGGAAAIPGNFLIPPAVIVTAGFFVARVDASETSVPIGDNNNLNSDYSPLALATQREPWIWRRSWCLGNNIATVTGGIAPPLGMFYPATNASRSVLDGPHIDAKTARRSQNDERLWFAISTWMIPTQGVQVENTGTLLYTLDLRVLGGIRKQRNRSAF